MVMLLFVANVAHVSAVELLLHVAVIVSLSASEHITCRLGIGHMFVVVSEGVSPL